MSGAALAVLEGRAEGPVLALPEPLSFWGGVDPATGRIIDVHHPAHGACVSGAVLMMPTSRGSCTGSGVLLDLVLEGRAPAALVFSGPEDVLTLGALVAAELFGRSLPVFRLGQADFAALATAPHARLGPDGIEAEGLRLAVEPLSATDLALSDHDRSCLSGERGEAARQAMRILCAVARQQGAETLTDVSRAHIDGCIYASPANLTFAEKMEALGARVAIPTTMNAISVDRENWRGQGVPDSFGSPAARLADAYMRMGARASFTCAPYLLPGAPAEGEAIGWSESNAVIYANSVLGARTAKHPDFLDLCIALTGRAPLSGVYLSEHRRARRVLQVEAPDGAGGAFWPVIGYLAGLAAPDRIPVLTGLATLALSPDDLKALCAAFGTTSAAPMLHVEGVTPEAVGAALPEADHVTITRADLATAWERLNGGPGDIDLVALGSPHASLAECRALAEALGGRHRAEGVSVIVTAGRDTIAAARADGTLARLQTSGVEVLPDLCWCSISRPVFPERAKVVLTDSGKYAHYGPGLSGCTVRLGTLDDCVEAALTGHAPPRLPAWLD
ncbi:cis-3-hydroxy-L-proline dehydratase [Aureimonas ureilytica]|uniref:cis-3-hydroxy-L-proline dehydratase n=1 Tax=Aureimonas ureilytica TaxID=401562 RepID=UPI00037815CC|nr:aconitase family protein [Aureimonas ureilytica]